MKKCILILLSLLLIWLAVRTEIDVGRCYDNNGNGKLYNGESYYNYIKYDEEYINENDIVITVCVLNPFNTYGDDIVFRFDKIIFKDIS